MKTPREILLETHRSAEPQLDRLSNEVVSAEFPNNERTTRRSSLQAENGGTTSVSSASSGPLHRIPVGFLAQAWQELFWSSRRTWAALAAVWMVLAVIYFTDKNSDGLRGLTLGIPSAKVMAEFQKQQDVLLGWMPTLPVSPAKIAPPQPPQPPGAKSSSLAPDENKIWG